MDPKLLSGTVDMLILQVVVSEATYGYRITQEVLTDISHMNLATPIAGSFLSS